ncbi:deoxyribose-phosphate aldolase [Thermofilum pendens]|uniref:Deoxyribose-phosphate aldolase n=1 Tax=Thermofilum pendens (strain DSM 2475 / Hrk 5) TaxID=368408 RepID=A1RY85_THEPD|nr:deoxyribose-phosphate aldolase [Thermofilum pendens]ABL78165.1 deoxyribose-phosphate aldolase [Thermofilum pendens Hrk 5]
MYYKNVIARPFPDPESLVEEVSRIIDHTNLRPEASEKELEKTCREAVDYGFYACCVPGFFVEKAVKIVDGAAKVVTVAGFPHGNSPRAVKVAEVKAAFEKGADEVDVVVNISLVKSGLLEEAVSEVQEILDVANESGGVLKVILETGYLTAEEVYRLGRELARIGVHFLKTSTGFGPRGATPEDILVMRRAVEGTRTKLKAAGGIRTGLQALFFYLLGVERIGTSSSLQIVNDLRALKELLH